MARHTSARTPARDQLRSLAASQRCEDHEYLVPVISRRQPQRTRPAAGFPPAQTAVEALQPDSTARGEMKLLQAHLLPGNLPGPRHQGNANSLAADRRESLQMADCAPVSDDRLWVPPQVHPADQGIASHRDKEPAMAGTEAGDDLVSHRRDGSGIDRRKRKPHSPAGIADRDPAVDEFCSQLRADLNRIAALADRQNSPLTHPGSLTRRPLPAGNRCRVPGLVRASLRRIRTSSGA